MTQEPPSRAISKRQLLLLVCCSSGLGDGLGDGGLGEYGGGREDDLLVENEEEVLVGIGRLEPAAACDAVFKSRENAGVTSSSPSCRVAVVVAVVVVRWCIDIETEDQI